MKNLLRIIFKRKNNKYLRVGTETVGLALIRAKLAKQAKPNQLTRQRPDQSEDCISE